MKLILYNDFQLGVLQGDTVVDVSDAVADLGHHNAQEMMQMIIADSSWAKAGTLLRPLDQLW